MMIIVIANFTIENTVPVSTIKPGPKLVREENEWTASWTEFALISDGTKFHKIALCLRELISKVSLMLGNWL